MIEELERVILTVPLPEHGLEVGDIGTVVLVHRDGDGYEVEFITLDGKTVAVVTVYADQIRQIREGQIANARDLKASA